MSELDRWVAPAAVQPIDSARVPSFAVVICAYQGAHLITDALESALEQTRAADEVIVVDDGSTDDLNGALRPYRSRITLLRKDNGGIGSAKNHAAHHTQADFLVFLDQDDAWLPGRLAALEALAVARPDLDLLTTDAWIERSGQRDGRWYGDFPVEDQRVAILRVNFLFSHVAVRREAFLAVGGSDESLRIEDWDCWIRLILSGSRAGCSTEPLAIYRVRPDSVSADDEVRRRNDLIVLEKALARPDLTPAERAELTARVAARRRTVELFDLRQRLATRDVGRRDLLRLARSAERRRWIRLQAILASLSPWAASWLLRRRSRTRRRRVLLVTHEASRTGAPRVAVQIAATLARRPDLAVIVLQRWGGPLESEFREAGATVWSEPLRRTRVVLRRWRRTRRLAVILEEAVAAVVVALIRPSVVYANTCLSAPFLRPGVRRGAKVVLHVHELASRSVPVLARYRLESSWPHIDVIACSEAAADGVRAVVGSTRLRVVRSVPDADAVRRLAASGGRRPAATATVTGCGTPDVGKGADQFAEVARIVGSRADRPVEFVWVGADGAPGVIPDTAPVRFAGMLDNPYPALASSTMLAVTSREDAFPLVVLEAMALGTPVVAFDVGGVREQVDDAGVLITPGDLDAFADAVLGLLEDEDEAARLGREGAMRVDEMFAFGDFQLSVLHAVLGAHRSL